MRRKDVRLAERSGEFHRAAAPNISVYMFRLPTIVQQIPGRFLRDQGAVQVFDERPYDAEPIYDFAVQLRRCCQTGVEHGIQNPVLLLDEANSGVSRIEAFGSTGQFVSLEFAHEPPSRSVRDNSLQFWIVFGNMSTHQQHGFGRRMVEAAGHFNRVGGNTEIKTTQMDVLRASPPKRGSHLRLIGRLVRAEPCVPIDAEDRLCRIGYVLGRKASQLCVKRCYQFEHGCFHVLVEKVFAWLEPLPAIVALEATEKLNHFLRKTSKGGGR